MNTHELRRNAVALALVLTAANLVASINLLRETHHLRDEAQACMTAAHIAAHAPPSSK